MQYLKKGILFIAGLVTITSCSEENPWQGSGEEGGIRLHLSTDGRVFTGGGESRSEGIIIPHESEFKLHLSKTDGSGSKEFSSLAEFENEESFPVGEYYLKAYYGDITKEGFEKPYFLGTELVQVQPATVSDVSVTTRLNNSMVRLTFSDEFKSEYPSYSAALSTVGSPFYIAQNENRVAYVQPGTVNINLTLTNAAGKTVTFNPASFVAEPQHRYNVNFSLEPGSSPDGALTLKILFDDNVESEIVEVVLSDEFFNSPAPEVRPMGFTNGETFSIITHEILESDPRFHLFAFGGIDKLKEANLSVSSTNLSTPYTPQFGNKVNLVGASELAQQLLESSGVKVSGFFKNPDKMAIVNLTDFIAELPTGTHTITFNAIDKFTHASESVSITVNVGDLSVESEVLESERPVFTGEEMKVYVSTNSSGLKNKLSFEVSDKNGVMRKATVKKIEEVTTRSGDYRYRFTLGIEKNTTTKLDVNVKNGNTIINSFSVEKVIPEYSLEVDAFSRYLLLKVTTKNPSDLAVVTDALSVKMGSTEFGKDNMVKDNKTGIIKIKGFVPSQTYTNLSAGIGHYMNDLVAFTTESATELPNGDFSDMRETIGISNIQAGGDYTITFIVSRDHRNYASIVINEPTGWASLNSLTCWSGSSNENTWFMVPSTYYDSDSRSMVIRSVGYSHNGTTPNKSHDSNTTYYCSNAPEESSLSKAAGEFFLGTYSYNGSEQRAEGVGFSSRPTSFSFDYTYTSLNGEKGVACIEVLDKNGSVIATSDNVLLTATDSETTVDLNMAGKYPFGVKASELRIKFKSSDANHPSITIPSGEALHEPDINATNFTSEGTQISANNYRALATGSVLKVKNLRLNYDDSAAAAKSLKSKIVKRVRK